METITVDNAASVEAPKVAHNDAPKAAPAPKKSRLATAMAAVQSASKWTVVSGVVLTVAVLAYGYNAGYVKQVTSKASDALASMGTIFPGLAKPFGKEINLSAAREAFAAGNINGAIDGYRAFIASNPTDIAARGELGNVFYTVGAIPEAAQAYFETANLAIEQNQTDVAEALLPVVSEGNPMLANELNNKLFEAQVRASDLAHQRMPFGQQGQQGQQRSQHGQQQLAVQQQG